MEKDDKLLSKIITEVKDSPISRVIQMLSNFATRSVLDGKILKNTPKLTNEDVTELTLISQRLKAMGLPYSALTLSAEISENLNSGELTKLYVNYDSTSRLLPQGSKRTTASVTRDQIVLKPYVSKNNWPVLLEEKLERLRERKRELMEEWRDRDLRERSMRPVEVPHDDDDEEEEEEEVESEDTSESSGDAPKVPMWSRWKYPTTPSELSTDTASLPPITKKATPVEPPSHRLSEIKASKLDDSQSAESDDSSTESASSSASESGKTVSEKSSEHNSDNKSVEEEFDVVDAGSESDNSISF